MIVVHINQDDSSWWLHIIHHIHNDGISLVLEHQSLCTLEPTRVHSRFSCTTTIFMFPGLPHPCFFAQSSCLLVNQGQSIACSNNYQEDLVALAIVEKVRLVYSLQRDKNSTSKLLGKNLQGVTMMMVHRINWCTKSDTLSGFKEQCWLGKGWSDGLVLARTSE